MAQTFCGGLSSSIITWPVAYLINHQTSHFWEKQVCTPRWRCTGYRLSFTSHPLHLLRSSSFLMFLFFHKNMFFAWGILSKNSRNKKHKWWNYISVAYLTPPKYFNKKLIPMGYVGIQRIRLHISDRSSTSSSWSRSFQGRSVPDLVLCSSCCRVGSM